MSVRGAQRVRRSAAPFDCPRIKKSTALPNDEMSLECGGVELLRAGCTRLPRCRRRLDASATRAAALPSHS